MVIIGSPNKNQPTVNRFDTLELAGVGLGPMAKRQDGMFAIHWMRKLCERYVTRHRERIGAKIRLGQRPHACGESLNHRIHDGLPALAQTRPPGLRAEPKDHQNSIVETHQPAILPIFRDPYKSAELTTNLLAELFQLVLRQCLDEIG